MTSTASEVHIQIQDITLPGYLSLPIGARGLVLFAHGSGSSRNSPRNRFVAEALQRYKLATLLFDLLSADEELIDNQTRQLRFDIDLLAERLNETADWVSNQNDLANLNLGYFGASTGAAAALTAAGRYDREVHAVVSRGGRPDLARADLTAVTVPTLLIVGDRDKPVIGMNQSALNRLAGEKKMEIVPRATHLFQEEGALEQVARLAADWFQKHLSA